MSALQGLAERQRRRAQVLELLDQISSDDPAFLPELAEALAAITQVAVRTQAPRQAARRSGRVTTADQIEKWFRQRNNQWAPVSEIIEGLGGNKNSIAHAIYKSSRDRFEVREPVSGGPRQFRLAQQGGNLDEAQ